MRNYKFDGIVKSLLIHAAGQEAKVGLTPYTHFKGTQEQHDEAHRRMAVTYRNAAQCLKDAEQAIAAAVEAERERHIWVSADERLPKKGVSVIGYFPDGDESGAIVAPAITHDGKRLVSDFPNSTASWFAATHWLPLPAPPALAAEEKNNQ